MSDRVNILEFESVVKEYENGVRALDGLTMSVPAGSIFGFIGLNGAGKTTTIRILAGLSKMEDGRITLFSKNLEDHGISIRKEIGFVLDEPMYFEWMTAGEYLLFAGAMYDLSPVDARLRTGELISFFDLEEKADSPIGTYSTGMKKKVSLAAAIIHNPKLIVLDEPLEGIDAVAAGAIKESLKLMAAKGTTILVTSHVLDTVEKFCDEIAVIHKGKMLLQCTTTEIRKRAEGMMSDQPLNSLEELFIELVAEKRQAKRLSWI